MRRAVCWFACLALSLCATARGQIVDATHIGATIDLSSQTWRYSPGDDPRYAGPSFDDSQWKPLSLLKGFPQQSYPIPYGTWWMRLNVRVPVGVTNIALSTNLAAYQIYVDGELIGQQGGFPNHPRMTRRLQEVYPIPDGVLRGGPLVVAIRNWTSPYLVPTTPPNPRLFLGDATMLQQDRDLFYDSRFFKVYGGNAAEGIIALILGIWALVLFRAQLGHREYLWLAVMCLSDAALAALMEVIYLTVVPSEWTAMPPAIQAAIGNIAFVLFVCEFLKVRVTWWIRLFCLTLLWPPIALLGTFSGWPPSVLVVPDLLVAIPADIAAPILAFRKWRRGDREAGALLLSLSILGIVDYANGIAQVQQIFERRLGPVVSSIPNLRLGRVELSPNNYSIILFYLTVGGIVLHRSMRITREQQRTAAELEEGRSVQAFLLGRDASAPGFTVESAYLPAQEVGGDFFQTTACSDGSLLVVIGDVAGKGLQAAMRVSMLIGAVRLSPELAPAVLLGKLNDVLLQDGSSGFTTCLAARLALDNTVIIANAGHLAPYLNGRELPIEGGLPLGVASAADYTEQIFPFAVGDALLLLSDGVIEATSPSGELFGFHRMAETAAQVTAANSLAETARSFGHQDDITVLLIHRTMLTGAPVTSLAPKK